MVHQIVAVTCMPAKEQMSDHLYHFFFIFLALFKQVMCLLLWVDKITATQTHSNESYSKANNIIWMVTTHVF